MAGTPRKRPSDDLAHISLLGGFELTLEGEPVRLSADAERLVAFLSLQDHRVPRAYVAGSLWTDGTQERAFGNLRSALWRLRQVTNEIVDADSQTLAIYAQTTCDVNEVHTTATRLRNTHPDPLPPIDMFTKELLPGWYDEWAIFERERHRQQALHALEHLAERHRERSQYGSAIQAALAAISLEPLRESPHRQLITIHLTEGNYSEAIRHYHQYANLIHQELGINPSPLLAGCLDEVRISA